MLDADQVLTTTRSVRRRLDLTRAVDRDTIVECLDIAFQAPNGSNQQTWDWVVVDDPGLRGAMATIYRDALADLVGDSARPTKGIDYGSGTQARISASVAHLTEHLHEVPVLVVPTTKGRYERADVFAQASGWGSILPAVWNFMLALRSRGLGSAWTTLHLRREQDMADLLGIPFDRVTQAGLFPVAHTIGTDFRVAEREPAIDKIRWNSWGSES